MNQWAAKFRDCRAGRGLPGPRAARRRRMRRSGERMTDSLLETRDLRKQFGGVHALDGVNFRLRRGELRCLIGPNGAGKSTFFKLLTGQLRPTSGTILFEGKPVQT